MAATEQDPMVIAREREQALEMLAAGKSYRYIAEALGRSVSTAHKRVDDALNEARRAKAATFVEIHLLRYEWQYDKLRQRIDAGVEPEKVSPHLAQVLAGERALLGLDAPKRLDVRNGGKPDADFSAVAELGADPEQAWSDDAGTG